MGSQYITNSSLSLFQGLTHSSQRGCFFFLSVHHYFFSSHPLLLFLSISIYCEVTVTKYPGEMELTLGRLGKVILLNIL